MEPLSHPHRRLWWRRRRATTWLVHAYPIERTTMLWRRRRTAVKNMLCFSYFISYSTPFSSQYVPIMLVSFCFLHFLVWLTISGFLLRLIYMICVQSTAYLNWLSSWLWKIFSNLSWRASLIPTAASHSTKTTKINSNNNKYQFYALRYDLRLT